MHTFLMALHVGLYFNHCYRLGVRCCVLQNRKQEGQEYDVNELLPTSCRCPRSH